MASGTIQTNAPINIPITPQSDVVIENYTFKKIGRTYFLAVRLHLTATRSSGDLFSFSEPLFGVTTPLATNSAVRCDMTGNICRLLSGPLNANAVLTLSGAFCI